MLIYNEKIVYHDTFYNIYLSSLIFY